MSTPPSDADDPSSDLIAQTLFELLARRAPGATLCPSEVARALAPSPGWRALMPRVRAVARSLADRGELLITRGGAPVEGDGRGGPIRLGRPGDAPFLRDSGRRRDSTG